MGTSPQNTSVQTLAAGRTRRGCENLIASAAAMPEDKKNWRPLEAGQTVNDLLRECVLVNLKWTATLQNRAYTRVSADTEASLDAALAAGEKIAERLRRSTAALIQAIKNVRDDELTERIVAPFGTYSLAECCLIAYWNSVYHEGQINYIQTLYGDQARHTAY